jgi:hypothetical protein
MAIPTHVTVALINETAGGGWNLAHGLNAREQSGITRIGEAFCASRWRRQVLATPAAHHLFRLNQSPVKAHAAGSLTLGMYADG